MVHITKFSQITAVWGLLLAAISPALGVEPRVAGLNDLLVIEPGTSRNGVPAPTLVNDGDCTTVEIAPSLHIHRFFYSGDREFQGPIIQGGPTVVIASHPRTGMRVYTNVTLAPGAPLIAHSKHGIEYIYDGHRIAIWYGRDETDVTVKYHSGRGFRRNWMETRQAVVEHVGDHLGASQTVGAVKETLVQGGQAVHSGVQVLDSTTADLINRTKQLGSFIPGVVPLSSAGDNVPGRQYQAEIERAQRVSERADPTFVPTIR